MTLGNGMHAHFAIGVASLRRDGFAGLVADGDGEVLTRPLRFSGSHLFVNADARYGSLVVEVLDADGMVLPGFSASDCQPIVRLDTTKSEITWKDGDLAKMAGRSVRFRFKLHVTTLFSFWVSQDAEGHSGGYLGGGGPDYRGLQGLQSCAASATPE